MKAITVRYNSINGKNAIVEINQGRGYTTHNCPVRVLPRLVAAQVADPETECSLFYDEELLGVDDFLARIAGRKACMMAKVPVSRDGLPHCP